MTTITVSSGVISNGLTVSSGDELVVLSGGLAQGISLLNGASATISSGGVLASLIDRGGVVSGSGEIGGASEILRGSVDGLTLVGDLLLAQSGASASGLTVSGRVGRLRVRTGGVAIGARLLNGATEIVSVGGIASGAIVSGGGVEIIEGGGSGVGDVVSSGGAEILQGGVASATTVVSGGILQLVTGSATGATISSGGIFAFEPPDISSGEILVASAVRSTVVLSGARLLSGAIEGIVGGIVRAGGEIHVINSGFTQAVTVSGGLEMVESGEAFSTLVAGRGLQVVTGAGVGSGGLISGGQEQVRAGGSQVRADVEAGGRLSVVSGTTTGIHVLQGGTLRVSAGGVDHGTLVTTGGVEYVFAGGVASGTQVHGMPVHSGRLTLNGGVARDARIYNGAVEQIGPGGTATGTTVLNGVERVLGGGVASGTTVSRGVESVLSGGIVSGLSLATAATKLLDNGLVLISGSETFRGTVSGIGVLAEMGGGELVLSGVGASFSGEVVISGGRVELAAAKAIGAGSVVFGPGSASKTLQVDANNAPGINGAFANTIVDFGNANDFIDLPSIAFHSGATASLFAPLSVLTVSDGGHTYRFTLEGEIASSFEVKDDGHGGTLISPRVAGFAQAAAALSPSKAVGLSPITTGGTSGHVTLVNATGAAGTHA